MQRLITSPLMRWADLLSVQRWAAANLPAEQAEQAEQEISRFFRAVELDRVVARVNELVEKHPEAAAYTPGDIL